MWPFSKKKDPIRDPLVEALEAAANPEATEDDLRTPANAEPKRETEKKGKNMEITYTLGAKDLLEVVAYYLENEKGYNWHGQIELKIVTDGGETELDLNDVKVMATHEAD